MLYGVTLNFLMVNVMFHFVVFIVSGRFLAFLSMVGVHFAGRMICLWDANFFSVWANAIKLHCHSKTQKDSENIYLP